MNDINNLNQLHRAAVAQYDRQNQKFAQLVQQEKALRHELARLARLDQSATAQGALSPMPYLGADLLWQGWLGRSKAALNIALAQILAQKAHEQKAVQRAFGKVTAIESLIGQAEERQRKKRETARLNSILELIHWTPDQ